MFAVDKEDTRNFAELLGLVRNPLQLRLQIHFPISTVTVEKRPGQSTISAIR